MLGHPAALLVLTAVLTGLLVPWITNRWAEHDRQVEAHRVDSEREREVTSAMVNRIGTASAQFLSAVDVGVFNRKGAEAAAEYRALKTASFEIASRLAAYFPDSETCGRHQRDREVLAARTRVAPRRSLL